MLAYSVSRATPASSRTWGCSEEGLPGGSYVGGLVGRNDGSITNSYVTGVITGSANGNQFYGYGYGYGRDTGGLVGDNQGSISRSHATGAVNGLDAVGG